MANNSRLFAYVDALSHLKNTSVTEEESFEKDYVPFIINRALSYHEDAVLAANMMNERSGTSKYLQFRFLSGTLRARKRYAKWLKNSVSDDVRLVAEYYNCSLRKAETLVSLHTPDQMSVIHRRLDRGGMTKKGKRHDTS